MTRKQFNQALALAKSDMDISVNYDHLIGCGLKGFKPVVTCLGAVARLLRWQCCYLDGHWGQEEIEEMWAIARHRFILQDDLIAGLQRDALASLFKELVDGNV